MAIHFKSVGTYREGPASYRAMVSKRNRGTITLDEKTLTFESIAKDKVAQIPIIDIDSFSVITKLKAPILQIKTIFGLELSFCPLVEEQELFKPSEELSSELFKAITYVIFDRKNTIIFDAIGFYCKNLPTGLSWKSGMTRGFILLSPEYLAFKPVEEGFFYHLSINHIQSINLEYKSSTPIVYVQTFENYCYSYTTTKLHDGKYIKNKEKTEEFFKILKHAKLEKIDEPKEFANPNKAMISKIETMLKVSTRIKLTMMREALGMNEKLFSEKIFEWAEKFDFIIDGEYLVIKAGSISAFVKNLLLDYDLAKEKKKKKQKYEKIVCQLCGKEIEKDSKVCPYCGDLIKKS